MRYLRNEKSIQINGSVQKRELKNNGYYHGYKGYRFYKKPNNQFQFVDYGQISSIIEFDNDLKALLYPFIMQIETALKNYVLEVIIKNTQSDKFTDAYSLLTAYNDYPKYSENYRFYMQKRLFIRNKIYSTLSSDFHHNQIVQHFYSSDRPVPIWAIFELISFGDFGTFVMCLQKNIRHDISKELNLNSSYDTKFKLLEDIIFTLKDLRNAVAHNEPIYDVRYSSGKISQDLKNCLMNEIGISVTFKAIVDYFILTGYILNKLQISKPKIYKMLDSFKNSCMIFYRKVNDGSIYFKIVQTDAFEKLDKMKLYLKNN